jgi:hypothetical protein
MADTTRPLQEPDRRKWTQPFVSANDGGSGVALLMEWANHMKDFKSAVGVGASTDASMPKVVATLQAGQGASGVSINSDGV